MGKNEKSSKDVAEIASKVLRTGKATPSEAQTLAGSVLTQTADKKPASKPAAPKPPAPRKPKK